MEGGTPQENKVQGIAGITVGATHRGRPHPAGVLPGMLSEDLICPAVHVRPLRGLYTLLALYPKTAGSVLLDSGAASRRPAFSTPSFRMTAVVSHVFQVFLAVMQA